MPCLINNPCPTANITQVSDWFTYSNTVTGGAFGFVMVFMVFLVAFIGMRAFPVRQSLPVSLFITFVSASLLAAAGMVGQIVVYLLLALTVGATVLLNLSKEPGN